jgi:hypothetical protein
MGQPSLSASPRDQIALDDARLARRIGAFYRLMRHRRAVAGIQSVPSSEEGREMWQEPEPELEPKFVAWLDRHFEMTMQAIEVQARARATSRHRNGHAAQTARLWGGAE